MTMQRASLVVVVCALADACADNLQIPETNVTPVAVARVLDDDRLMPTFEYTGTPVEITLDGSLSADPDGAIRTYRWLSATRASDVTAAWPSDESGQGDTTERDSDAGSAEMPSGRWVPEGAGKDWPDDVVRPVVRLPLPGTYGFTLWVIDDRGRISDPSSLTLQLVRPSSP